MMRKALTAHILVRNDSKTIRGCLDSLDSLKCEILVGDAGSRDDTLSLCGLYDARVMRVSAEDGAQARNAMASHSSTEWNLWIEPNERIVGGHDELARAMLQNGECLALSCIDGDLVTKQVRAWKKSSKARFKNPVFERLDLQGDQADCFIASVERESEVDRVALCQKWHKSSPFNTEPLYYLASSHLKAGNVDSFLAYADSYLHAETKRQMSYFMTRYYVALVNCYAKQNYRASLESLLPCLAEKPTMAEFWCLLGDVYYKMADYGRAKEFYENAVVLGSRRLSSSLWPMQISKYSDYPVKMMGSCDEMILKTRIYVRQ